MRCGVSNSLCSVFLAAHQRLCARLMEITMTLFVRHLAFVTSRLSTGTLSTFRYSCFFDAFNLSSPFSSGDSVGVPIAQQRQRYLDVSNQRPNNLLALNHETQSSTVYDLIPYAVQQLRSKGYQFATVAECLNMPAYTWTGAPESRTVSFLFWVFWRVFYWVYADLVFIVSSPIGTAKRLNSNPRSLISIRTFDLTNAFFGFPLISKSLS